VRFVLPGVLLVGWLGYLVINFMCLGQTPWFGKIELTALLSAGVLCYCCYSMREASMSCLYGGLMVLGFILGFCALFQYFVDTSWHPVSGTVKSQYAGRVSSLFGQPNSFAVFMLMLLPYPILQLLKSDKLKIVYGCLALLFMWCIIVSVSRAVILVTFPVLAVVSYFAVVKWRAKILVFLGLGVIFAGMHFGMSLLSDELPERFGSLVANGGEGHRKVYYAAAMELFTQRPLFGVGLGNFQLLWDRQFPVLLSNSERHVHSDYLEILCETGLVGLCVFLFAVLLVIGRSLKKMCSNSEARGDVLHAQVALCGLVGFGLHEVVDIGLQMIGVLFIVAIYLAVLMRIDPHQIRISLNKGAMLGVATGLIGGVVVFLTVFLPTALSARHSSRAWGYASYVHAYANAGQVQPVQVVEYGVRLFDEAIDWDNQNASAYRGKGYHMQSYKYLENIDMKKVVTHSVGAFDRALAITPNNWRLWADRGVSLSLDLDRKDEADASFKKALELAPMNAPAWMHYAEFLEVHGEKNEFVVALQQILILDPDRRSQGKWAQEELEKISVKAISP